jgi:uncharacterized damage-inducible protein DinB
MTGYIGDFADADLLVRPVPGANHTAWQLGHLINSECGMIKAIGGGTEVPAGFGDQHGSKNASSDSGFLTKKEYLDLFNKVRQTSLDTLAKLPDADLDKPNPHAGTAKMAATIGDLFQLIANHEMMHAGQVAVVRRKLGKPVLF